GLELRRVTVELGEIRPIPPAEQARPSGAAPSAPPWTTGSAPAQPAEGPELVAPKKPSSTSSPAARPNPPAQPKPDKTPDTQKAPSGNGATQPAQDAAAPRKSDDATENATPKQKQPQQPPKAPKETSTPDSSGQAAIPAAPTSLNSAVPTAADDGKGDGAGEADEADNTSEAAAADRAADGKTANASDGGTQGAGDVSTKQDEGTSEPVRIDTHGFEGGHRVTLRFSDEMSPAVVADMIAQAITRVDPSYTDPQGLIKLIGTRGSGLKAGTYEVQKFSEMELLASPALDPNVLQKALQQWQQEMAETPTFEEVNNFDSAVGVEMQETALIAILVSLIAIVAYIWFRFQQITFGLAAVIALVHDVLATLGMLALASYLADTPIGKLLLLYDFKINLPIIAALLTIIGYSLNDTIVVFDRIREVRGKNPALTEEMINTSLNQTLSRTLLTSLTTLLVVVVLYVIGGEGIHGFAFSLVVGVIVGTYSSIYIASPSLLWLTAKLSQTSAAATARKPVAAR
ncbi:MAG: protein translocase subunit SecF, partial [Planctomycetota bacterium]